jgi:hypothetical protein
MPIQGLLCFEKVKKFRQNGIFHTIYLNFKTAQVVAQVSIVILLEPT